MKDGHFSRVTTYTTSFKIDLLFLYANNGGLEQNLSTVSVQLAERTKHAIFWKYKPSTSPRNLSKDIPNSLIKHPADLIKLLVVDALPDCQVS